MQAENRLDGPLHHEGRIADDEGTHRRADDDEPLERLNEHNQVPAHRRVTSDYTRDDKDGADNDEHGPRTPPERKDFKPLTVADRG